MKKILKPSEPEDVIYYSDINGEMLSDFVPVTVTVECNYGSKYDGAKLELHFTDNELQTIFTVLKDKLAPEIKEYITKRFS
jgi:hypothetical protein